MYEPVYVPYAITLHGEWVAPETAAQEDYDILFCEFCRVKISIVIDELTGVKSFVHTPLNLETARKLSACPYSGGSHNAVTSKKTIHKEYIPLLPTSSRLPPSNTVIQNWQCCWCHICWYGAKLCPQCGEGIYTLEDNHKKMVIFKQQTLKGALQTTK